MKTPEEIKKGIRQCLGSFVKFVDACGQCPYCCEEGSFCKGDLFHDAISYIEQMEKRASLNNAGLNTLRNVEIVRRCKDCKRWGAGYPGETDKIKCCQVAGYMIGENGYCLYAEAKDGGDGS